MGNSLKSIKDRLYGKQEIRLLMCGLDAAGKTTVLYKLRLGEVVTTIPTIGFNVETVDYQRIHITSWDVGGRCQLRPLWRHYYKNTNAVVFVIDSNDRERISYSKYELQRLMQEDELGHLPVLILANKQDLPNAMSIQEITDHLQLSKLNCTWHIQGSSAINGDGLYEGLDWLDTVLTKKAAKEAAIKPVKETVDSNVVQKPRHMLSSLYNSFTSYFTHVQ